MTVRVVGLLTIVLTAIAGVVALPGAAPVGAATQGFTLTVPAGTGVLQIDDAEESQTLGTPTSINGTVDDETGVISGVSLSTPPIEFDTVAQGHPAHVTATFEEAAPGTGTGSVAATDDAGLEGNVILRTAVVVKLHLLVGNPVFVDEVCETPAVNLELLSTTPYVEGEGGEIVDPDFTVPQVPSSPGGCFKELADGVNELLAGPGHSLSMFIEGNLEVPNPKPKTTTTLSVDPSGGSMRGDEVTLKAAVAPIEASELTPTGIVLFRDGAQSLGSAELQPDGTATLATRDLRPGDRSLTVAYQGDTEFGPSQSAALTYEVAPVPILTGTVPEFITRGAPPVEFDLSIDNVGSPRPIANARVDFFVPDLSVGDLVLERQLPDGTWVPVPLTFTQDAGGQGGGVEGTLGPEDGTVVPAGALETVRLRISALGNAGMNRYNFNVELVPVDPEPGEDDDRTLAGATWPINVIAAARIPTMVNVTVHDPALRPGQELYIDLSMTTASGPVTSGEVEILFDGQLLPFRPESGYGPLKELTTRARVENVGTGHLSLTASVPDDASIGPHTVSARYLGDTSFLPSQSNWEELPVLEALGPLYTCDFTTISANRTGAFVQASVKLPDYAEAGDELELEDLDITLILGGANTIGYLGLVASNGAHGDGYGVNDIEIDLGDAGTIHGTDADFTPYADLETSTEVFFHLRGLEGTIVVDGEPGEVVPLPIERIEMSGVELTQDLLFTFDCAPNDEPVVLDEVGVAGVSLVAETTTDTVRTGDPVKLTATAAPAGPFSVVEFFSGAQSLGTASATSGTATLTVDDLPAGTNLLTARYIGVRGAPYQSNIVEVVVRPETECPGFTDAGSGRVVRLVYLELLQRCPDQAGYDYWVGELDDGVSPEAFANTIAKTEEARKVFVDKAYRLMFDRPAEADGKEYWAAALAHGRFDRLVADLGASPEFWANAGRTNEGFVRLVYQRILRRPAGATDVTYWAGRLDRGESRRTLIRTLFNLSEPLSVVVGDAYLEILGRDPSPAESTAGVTLLRTRSNLSALYGQLIGTPEFRTRAETLPNPED